MAFNSSSIYVSPALTDMSVANLQDDTRFIATRVFPMLKVPKQSAMYWTWPSDALMRNSVEKRAPGDESAGKDFEYKLAGPYNCERWALHVDLDEFVKANVDDVLDLDRDATVYLNQQMLVSKEVKFNLQFLTAGVWTNDVAVTNGQWTAPGSTPIDDCEKAIEAVKLKSGIRPNTAVFTYPSWLALKHHAQLKGYIAWGTVAQPSIITMDLVASILGLDKIYVSEAVTNTSSTATANVQYINKANVLFCYVAAAPGIMTATAGYTFAWTGAPGGGEGQLIRKIDVPLRTAERVEIEAFYDQRVVAPDMGALLLNVVP